MNRERIDLGTRASRPHLHWHSRGYVPHFDSPGLVQSVTFRLHDSVPGGVIEKWKLQLAWTEGAAADDPKSVALRDRIAGYEDAGHGGCWLAQVEIAQIVEHSLLHFDGQRYHLVAWCIMPNHVHAIIETIQGHRLGDVVHSWKSFTAKEANRLLGRIGIFWMPDYYDRFIRDDRHLAAEIAYIENNPVKAGLVQRREGWPFSSASQ